MDDLRRTVPLMRLVFALGALLSLLAGIQLVVLPRRTDAYFAWTIGTPSAAAFLGSFYWGAVAIAGTSFPRRAWARARAGVYGVVAFFWVTMATTLMHLDRFHLDSGGPAARVSAWAWLIVYLVIPPLATVALVLQHRARGVDPVRAASMARPHRLALAVAGSSLVALSILLFAAPATASDIWPWQLTPLTARAASAWVVGLGIILCTMAWEGDHDRAAPAAWGVAVLPVLLVVSLVRLEEDVRWTAGTAYVVVVAAVWALGGVSVLAAGRRRGEVSAPAAPAAPASPGSSGTAAPG